jgi:hypothetical protein
MKLLSFKSLFLTFAFSLLPVGAANALSITVTGANRTGTLGDAIDAGWTDGNLKASDVKTEFGGDWTKEGEITKGLSNDLLSITFTKGTWGDAGVAGTWTIDPSFWTLYGSAVIGWHAGNGGGDPDSFMFLIEPGATTGTWSYEGERGGGLSNFQLYGSGPPQKVPDGGATVIMLGLVLGGVAVAHRFIKKY